MNSRNRDEPLPSTHYGRAQFLSDVAWMGMVPDQAFSRTGLRRQRDQLMNVHHPDRGGCEEMAARINVTYARMNFWLDRHLENRNYLRLRRERVLAREAAKTVAKRPETVTYKIETIGLYAALLGAAATAMGIGLTTLARRRR